MRLKPIALSVTNDEPCLLLLEEDRQSPGNRGFHRYQILYVMRGDKPAEYSEDLGSSKKFRANGLRIPGGAKDETTGVFHIEHTVGELRDMANWKRAHPRRVKIVRSDLFGGYYGEREKQLANRHHN